MGVGFLVSSKMISLVTEGVTIDSAARSGAGALVVIVETPTIRIAGLFWMEENARVCLPTLRGISEGQLKDGAAIKGRPEGRSGRAGCFGLRMCGRWHSAD